MFSKKWTRYFDLSHRRLAAFFATADRCSAESFFALASPPRFPKLTAALSFPSSVSVSSLSSPVAIRAILIALPMTSAGRFSPLGPLGTLLLLFGRTGHITMGAKYATVARQRLQPCAAVLAVIEIDTGVLRHRLL